MKTVYYCASTINGFIAGPNNSLDWLFQFGNSGDSQINEFIGKVGAIAMGSTTYQWIYHNQVSNQLDKTKAWPYKVPAWVFTTRKTAMPLIPNVDIDFVQGDVKPIHDHMKKVSQDKIIWIVGGGGLAAQFYDSGLLNELIITLAPTCLAEGAPLFPKTTKTPLKLLSLRNIDNQFVEIHYEVPRPR